MRKVQVAILEPLMLQLDLPKHWKYLIFSALFTTDVT